MLASDAVTEFILEQRLRNNSPATIEFYETNLRRFLHTMSVQDAAELDRPTIVKWRLEMQDSQLSPASVRTYDKTFRVFCRWLVERGVLTENPMERLPQVKVPHGTGDYVVFSDGDIRAILAAAKAPGRLNRLRDLAIIALLLDTGIRAGELVSLTMTSINWEESVILVKGKTGRRDVPINACQRHLRLYMSRERRALPGESALFTTIDRRPMSAQQVTQAVRVLTDQAKVKSTKRGPHTFRHTFAVEYLRSGGDVFSLMRILGHSQIATTQRYVHWLMGDVRSLHARHSPGNRWL